MGAKEKVIGAGVVVLAGAAIFENPEGSGKWVRDRLDNLGYAATQLSTFVGSLTNAEALQHSGTLIDNTTPAPKTSQVPEIMVSAAAVPLPPDRSVPVFTIPAQAQ